MARNNPEDRRMSQPIIVEAHGARIPALGLGTFRSEGQACVDAVLEALRVGYRHVDTAAMYGNEAEVGEGLRVAGLPRDEVFVTTKVWWTDIAPGALQASAEASLKKLGLHHVDLLHIHWPNPEIPLADSLGALCDAKRRGLARHIGVCNFPIALLDEAVRLCDEPLVALQCEYHPTLSQHRLLAEARRHGLAFTSYSPIGKGTDTEEKVVQEIAVAHGKTGAQVVLRWHVQQDGVIAIPKSSHPVRIQQNYDIWDFSLGDEEMAAISRMARPDGRMINPAFAPQWDS
ncbi:2,5-didehydrogluconate reductase [Alsobacter metallidurans]|uniref:2,5-didehydrogluconate reductase n=2 Tax=Alsobacter metallidurans TaxID=340221 RepID=A0A917MKP8_9HYPH|nr:2,5-didehydrogluconate reductase [Alsobacter metallidurans]